MNKKNKADVSYQSKLFISELALNKYNPSQPKCELNYKKSNLINETTEKRFNDEQLSRVSSLDNTQHNSRDHPYRRE